MYLLVKPKDDDSIEESAITYTIFKSAARDIKSNLISINGLSEFAGKKIFDTET